MSIYKVITSRKLHNLTLSHGNNPTIRNWNFIICSNNNNNNSCESHLSYTNMEWMYLSTQCLYLISFCTLPTPVIFRVEQEKSSLPSIFHFPFKNCNNSLHFHLICTSYIPFCFTTVSPFIAKSIISKLIFRRPNLSFSSTSMINNFEID